MGLREGLDRLGLILVLRQLLEIFDLILLPGCTQPSQSHTTR